jgi:hypothetical protein
MFNTKKNAVNTRFERKEGESFRKATSDIDQCNCEFGIQVNITGIILLYSPCLFENTRKYRIAGFYLCSILHTDNYLDKNPVLNET